MNRSLLVACAILQFLSSHVLRAEQEVTLKTGTKIIGDVTIGEQNVKVKIGDSEVVFDISDIARVKSHSSRKLMTAYPDHLLMLALELRVQSESLEGPMALLAEAHRLAPEDTRIAYWYADTLLGSGLGKEAHEILEAHHNSLSQTYPNRTSRLEVRLGERLELEALPAGLVRQIDKLNAIANVQSHDGNTVHMYVRFRLVDQHGKSIDRSDFRISCNGNKEQLQNFEDGHYLLTYNRNSGYANEPCQLYTLASTLKPERLKLTASSHRVANAGEFVIERFDDSSKVEFQVKVSDTAGKPIEGAHLALHPDAYNNSGPTIQSALTDADGRAKIQAFPVDYSYTVSAIGFASQRGQLEMKDRPRNGISRDIKLYPAMSAKVRASWRASGVRSRKSDRPFSISGETIINIDGNQGESNPRSDALFHARQVEDQLTIRAGSPYSGIILPDDEVWVGRLPETVTGNSPGDYFQSLDVTLLSRLRKQSQELGIGKNVARGEFHGFQIEIKPGEVYVGAVPYRNPTTAEFMLASFKLYVESVANAADEQ